MAIDTVGLGEVVAETSSNLGELSDAINGRAIDVNKLENIQDELKVAAGVLKGKENNKFKSLVQFLEDIDVRITNLIVMVRREGLPSVDRGKAIQYLETELTNAREMINGLLSRP